jgi:hypothetical protein
VKATIEISQDQELALRRLASERGETDVFCLVDEAIKAFLAKHAEVERRAITPIDPAHIEELLSLSGALKDDEDDLARRVAGFRELPGR